MTLVAALFVLPPLGQRVVNGPHQARFAVLAQDMLERHVWFSGRIAGEPYRNKPPLYPWAVALFSRATGRVTEAAAQAPSALAAIGSVAFTFLLGRRLFGRRAALWSALVLLTSFDIFIQSQTATPDMLVVLFAAMSAYFFWLTVGGAPSPRAINGFYAAIALGVFAKGPVGLLPLLIGAVWLWTEGRGAGLRRLWSASGVAILVGLTLLWLGPYLAAGTDSFARDVVWADWLSRYLGGPRLEPIGDTIGEWWLGLLPWTPLLPLAITWAFSDRRRPGVRFALLWQLVTLAVVLISSNPRARYLLPSYPAAALLVGRWADRHGGVPTRLARLMGWVALASAIAGASSLVWYPRLYPHVFPPVSWVTLWPALVMVAGGIAMLIGLRTARPALVVSGAAGAALVVFGVGVWPYNTWVNRQYEYGRLERVVAAHARDGQVGAYFNRELYQTYFYAGRPLAPIQDARHFREFLARPGRPIVLVNRENWQTIDGASGPALGVIARIRLGPDEILAVRAVGRE